MTQITSNTHRPFEIKNKFRSLTGRGLEAWGLNRLIGILGSDKTRIDEFLSLRDLPAEHLQAALVVFKNFGGRNLRLMHELAGGNWDLIRLFSAPQIKVPIQEKEKLVGLRNQNGERVSEEEWINLRLRDESVPPEFRLFKLRREMLHCHETLSLREGDFKALCSLVKRLGLEHADLVPLAEMPLFPVISPVYDIGKIKKLVKRGLAEFGRLGRFVWLKLKRAEMFHPAPFDSQVNRILKSIPAGKKLGAVREIFSALNHYDASLKEAEAAVSILNNHRVLNPPWNSIDLITDWLRSGTGWGDEQAIIRLINEGLFLRKFEVPATSPLRKIGIELGLTYFAEYGPGAVMIFAEKAVDYLQNRLMLRPERWGTYYKKNLKYSFAFSTFNLKGNALCFTIIQDHMWAALKDFWKDERSSYPQDFILFC